ncbi:aromatic ring-hydroxylating dioxygenase subunit alpha [Streptomyces sp. TR1341]|uniref:Rieske 2Fe-2S domain-containing protein n=1 Tax=Streptomyces sp. TR1341 TaxID=2601266 RepID=UPI00138AC1CF|nr:aromatic ring-hydroxylating dioxygenase subunit alpha [Streptomyces sp. TR1341]
MTPRPDDVHDRGRKNHWYMAAWPQEVGRSLLARTVCGEPVLLYRKRDGTAVALADRCVHRRYPLSLGRLVEDTVECGYHGFTYDCSGRCVSVPGQDRIPAGFRVRTYPLVERDGLVWLWPGDSETADPADIPACPWPALPSWATVRDTVHSPFRTELLLDNLMDLSHETFLHAGLIGTPEVAETPITWETDKEHGVVTVSRHMSAVTCPTVYVESTGLSSPVDRHQDIEFHAPSLLVIHARIAPVGAAAHPDGSDPDAAHAKIIHFLTPETATTCWDFWAISRDFALRDDTVGDYLLKMNREVVQQDLRALTELERVIAAEPEGVRERSIRIDAGALAARSLLRSRTGPAARN